MTIEEAVLVLKRYQGYEPMEDGNILKHSFDLTDETVDTLLSAMRTELAGEALTMEQLREMDGKPMWVERNEEPYDGKWFIVDHADVENPDKTLYTKEGVTYSDYGKYFTAYAYPPAHIDREDGKDRNVRTNADWIRAMSDQELEAFLSGAGRKENKRGAVDL